MVQSGVWQLIKRVAILQLLIWNSNLQLENYFDMNATVDNIKICSIIDVGNQQDKLLSFKIHNSINCNEFQS